MEERRALTVGEVARRMEVDRERVAVLLGSKQRQQRVTYEVGVRLCRALNVDPYSVNV